ncbi:MAG: Tol-Pal system beta propeller repeat protein TolB [Oceanococcus sp.]
MRSLLFLFVLTFFSTGHAALEIEVTGGEVQPVSVGIVPFSSEQLAQLDIDIARIVETDLRSSGLFSPFPREDMLAKPSQQDQVRYENWRALGVEHLVIGSIGRTAEGQWQVEFHLLDVFKGTRSLGYAIPVSASGLRYAGHQISDLIYQKLTGHRGVFNTRIAYITAEGDVKNRRYKLMIADADGHEPKQLVSSAEPIMSPTWSPDGRQMAFVAFDQGQSSVYLQTIATGVVRKLTNYRGINGAPSFSPDGRQLAITLSHEGNPEIYVLNLADNATRRITTDPAIDTEPAFSPDGKHLVFTSDRAGRPQIYRIDLNGQQKPKRITFEGKSNARASYSPDGSFMSLVHQTENGFYIAAMEVATRAIRVLSNGPLDESPSFAPNGVAIIYATRGRRGAELATVAIDTGIQQSLSQPGDVREPAWSPFNK